MPCVAPMKSVFYKFKRPTALNGRPFLEFDKDESRRRLIISLSLLLKSSLTAFWRCFYQFDRNSGCLDVAVLRRDVTCGGSRKACRKTSATHSTRDTRTLGSYFQTACITQTRTSSDVLSNNVRSQRYNGFRPG